jgi:hypothetical protein
VGIGGGKGNGLVGVIRSELGNQCLARSTSLTAISQLTISDPSILFLLHEKKHTAAAGETTALKYSISRLTHVRARNYLPKQGCTYTRS